ncbi:Poly [ADP-ribose] polymerase [Chionoecetes opilio]|uniref:Poly [ADP-ribose] polymerase n=1 Tax=Chionoecetes opilio TaxID=41210 RepID=A0A8J5D0G7_CHIOP|nr:Poly [ADP-ribose] polymerase [Chionoecetes opilio]
MEEDFPYKAEYSKSGRASCRGCKGKIEKETLRLAVMVQSPMFDGKVPHWYHYMCFFGKQRPKTVADIAHLDSLRWEDQEEIKARVESGAAGKGAAGKGATSKKGGKKGKGSANGVSPKDYNMEYAKSGRAMCRGCENKILKGEVRISKKDYEAETAKMYGPADLWHHVDCFIKRRAEFEFFDSGESLPGFFTLSADDKKMVKEKLKKIAGKRKAEDEPDCATKKIKSEDDEIMRKQNKIMFRHRDKLEDLKKKNLSLILEDNEQYIPVGESRMLEVIKDIMTFGALEPCDICHTQGFMYM